MARTKKQLLKMRRRGRKKKKERERRRAEGERTRSSRERLRRAVGMFWDEWWSKIDARIKRERKIIAKASRITEPVEVEEISRQMETVVGEGFENALAFYPKGIPFTVTGFMENDYSSGIRERTREIFSSFLQGVVEDRRRSFVDAMKRDLSMKLEKLRKTKDEEIREEAEKFSGSAEFISYIEKAMRSRIAWQRQCYSQMLSELGRARRELG